MSLGEDGKTLVDAKWSHDLGAWCYGSTTNFAGRYKLLGAKRAIPFKDFQEYRSMFPYTQTIPKSDSLKKQFGFTVPRKPKPIAPIVPDHHAKYESLFSSDDEETDDETGLYPAVKEMRDQEAERLCMQQEVKDVINMVHGIQHEDLQEDDSDNECEKNQILNNQIYAVYFDDYEGMFRQTDNNYLLFHSRSIKPPKLSAEEILQKLVSEPMCVNGIGVSAIELECFVPIWDEIISKEKTWMDDENGKGYMVHPMWRIGEQSNSFTVREISYNFGGWHKYRSDHIKIQDF